jgi:hypothetical protein
MNNIKNLLTIMVVLAGLAPLPAQAQDEEAYRLAFLDAGHDLPKDDSTVARIRSLLTQLSADCVESVEFVGGQANYVSTALRKKGIEETRLTVLEGINRVIQQPQAKICPTVFAMYVMMRDAGQSQDEAIAGLRDILGGLRGMGE